MLATTLTISKCIDDLQIALRGVELGSPSHAALLRILDGLVEAQSQLLPFTPGARLQHGPVRAPEQSEQRGQEAAERSLLRGGEEAEPSWDDDACAFWAGWNYAHEMATAP